MDAFVCPGACPEAAASQQGTGRWRQEGLSPARSDAALPGQLSSLLSVLAADGDQGRSVGIFFQGARCLASLRIVDNCSVLRVWSQLEVKNILFVTVLSTGSKEIMRNMIRLRTALRSGGHKSCGTHGGHRHGGHIS